MIYVSQLKNFDTSKIIKIFHRNSKKLQSWDETLLLRVGETLLEEQNPKDYEVIRDLVKRVTKFVSHDENFRYIDNIEIVRYAKNCSKRFHFDYAKDCRTGASITYLNHDFVGGQTVVEGVTVQPIEGRTVYFNGKEFKHAVMNVLDGERYTLTMWYGRDSETLIPKDYLN